MTHSFLLFVIYALCIYRLTRLLVEDTISDPVREWLRKRSFGELVERDYVTGNVISRTPAPKPGSPFSWAWKLMTCYWCLSLWISAVIVVVAYFNGSWFQYVCIPFAFSAIAGVISERR